MTIGNFKYGNTDNRTGYPGIDAAPAGAYQVL